MDMLGSVQKLNDPGNAMWGGMRKILHSKIRVMNSCADTISCENMVMSRLVKTAHSKQSLKWLRLIKCNIKVWWIEQGKLTREMPHISLFLPQTEGIKAGLVQLQGVGASLCTDALWGEQLWFCHMQPYLQHLKLWPETL